ncbi:hypothetical protein GR702_17570 [Novosphingobium sp. FGD1]|uniref:Uncharacterized protein n=1 Tax=Novosphingobium silvae TaxID=2692619 RepID=A0A7X4GJ81_9SPHN|nr:hypothetical protein [Novosphingobium silvae]MYL99573.1 hypothetical protein [Novosphingobium silvae]
MTDVQDSAVEAMAKAHCDFFGGEGWWDTGLLADTKPKAIEAMHAALSAMPAATALEAWQELVEYDDRTSPEGYPDMALITFEELRMFMSRAAFPDCTCGEIAGEDPDCSVHAASLPAPDTAGDVVANIYDHICHADRSLEAMTDATVNAIEAWKLNDADAIDKAMRHGLERIAKDVRAILLAALNSTAAEGGV